ncbi:MAG: creatininase family protein [Candidatus Thermoplasmatota archaeon]
MTMSELKAALTPERVVILPIGATEEHGAHLPLGTDSLQPIYVAEEVAKRTGALIAPPLYYGMCASTANFPGTLSLSFDTLRALVREILMELVRQGARKIVVLSGHAGRLHMSALRLAAEEVVKAHDIKLLLLSDYDIAYELHDIPEGDGHAGTIETSRIMDIAPELVKGRGMRGKAEMPRFQVLKDPERCFPSGVIGDPTIASKDKGRVWNERIVQELEKLVRGL